MVVHMAKSNETLTIDYRGTAPAAAKADMFLDAQGKVIAERAKLGHTASTVPGTVAGLYEAHQRWGRLPWEVVVQPAVTQALEGIEVSRDLAWAIQSKKSVLQSNPASKQEYFGNSAEGYVAGDLWRRPELAETLQHIARKGRDGFYKGRIAKKIHADMKKHGGLITRADLKAYEARVQEPLWGDYRGYRIATMPPPAGGIHLLQMLNIIERFPMGEYGHNSARSLHVLAEAMKRAYAYRAQYLGDPAFHPVPVEQLLSESLTDRLAAQIKPGQATPVKLIQPEQGFVLDEGPDTTHYSVMDSEGNGVSNTYTLSASFGSGVTIAGTGILMNNQINNFALREGIEGAGVFASSVANAMRPGKRTRSTQTPLMVFRDGEPLLLSGTPGGRRIITTMLQMVSNVVDYGMNVAEATHAPRIFQGWREDELEYETGISVDTLDKLKRWGHQLESGATMGSTQSIMNDSGNLYGAADPRRPGAAAVGVAVPIVP